MLAIPTVHKSMLSFIKYFCKTPMVEISSLSWEKSSFSHLTTLSWGPPTRINWKRKGKDGGFSVVSLSVINSVTRESKEVEWFQTLVRF